MANYLTRRSKVPRVCGSLGASLVPAKHARNGGFCETFQNFPFFMPKSFCCAEQCELVLMLSMSITDCVHVSGTGSADQLANPITDSAEFQRIQADFSRLPAELQYLAPSLPLAEFGRFVAADARLQVATRQHQDAELR